MRTSSGNATTSQPSIPPAPRAETKLFSQSQSLGKDRVEEPAADLLDGAVHLPGLVGEDAEVQDLVGELLRVALGVAGLVLWRRSRRALLESRSELSAFAIQAWS